MSEHYEVLVTPNATDMLRAHVRFLADVSEQAARKLSNSFTTSARTLEEFPERCPWLSYPGMLPGKYRKLIFCQHYLAIFQIKNHKVYIHYVIDTRQDYQWLISAT
jgi:plasmid stabilization system protein ParE